MRDRRPELSGDQLLDRLVPPARFADVRFESYVPSPEHPSQAAARHELERFTASMSVLPDTRRRLFRKAAPVEAGRAARYLDGGFGVGKTHLLASAWHVGPSPKAYCSFAELTAIIGFLGMERAVEAFGRHRLLCIDEFELDDVANTLMAVTFLRSIIARGTKVIATSNTLPDRLGEGRFAADDFTREIAAIAGHFEVLRVDGPDYRARFRTEADPLQPAAFAAAIESMIDGGASVASDRFSELLVHLRVVHPIQVGPLLDGVDAVALDALTPIANQGDALLFVHFIDELYDAEIDLVATGCAVQELFPASYRSGGYRKKYGRCESRLASMLASSPAVTRS